MDTETRGLSWFDPDHRAFLATWADDAGSHAAWEHEPDQLERLFATIRDADEVVFHNAPFDIHQIRERWGFDCLTDTRAEILDTNQLARVAVPERKFGSDDDYDEGRSGYRLKDLAKTYLRKDAADSETAIDELAKSIGVKLKSTGGFYEVARSYPEAMQRYAEMDTVLTRDLLPVLEDKLNDRTLRVWDLERETQPHLIRAEQRGVAIDQSKVLPLKKEYERRAEAAHELVTAELGSDALDGTDALREALLTHGVPLHRKTPTGQIATHQFALAEFEADFPALAALSEWRTATKFLSTYLSPMVGREVVHTQFNQQGAHTGRMSCSRPNLQNIPVRAGSEIREMFVPREGHVFIVSDFDAIEIRLLAWYLNSDEYRQLIIDGLDPHAWMASNIWGGEVADYEKGTAGEKRRSEAKNVLFAIVYGAGAPRVSDMLGISKDEAKKLIGTIKNTLPGYNALAGYKGRIRRKVDYDGHVTTIMGRRQPVNKEKVYMGLSALIQGSAADIFKLAVCRVSEALEPLGGQPVLFVHDEVVSEIPIEHAEEALRAQNRAMEQCYDLLPPLAVTGQICRTSWAEGK